MEKFSDLVNRIAIEEPDGLNIFISQAQIDQAYLGLLNRAVPFIPEGSDAQTGESIITSFSLIKSAALKVWANVKLESSTGLMFEFKPSFAGPKDWYDRKNKDIWTSHSFKVTEAAGPAKPESVSFVKKIDDVTMAKIVPLTESARPVKPTQLAAILLEAHPNRPVMTTPKMVNASLQTGGNSPRTSARMVAARQQPRKEVRDHRGKKGAARPQPRPEVRDHRGKNGAARPQPWPEVRDHRGKGKDAGAGFELQNRYLPNVQRMKLEKRIAVSQYIRRHAPTSPATTNSISISFDYCLVNISRPWYRSEFINDRSWYIPNTTKGQLTARVNSGANLTLMPVGVVAIKNLNIQAHWSAADIGNSTDATSFGPFK
jgi:hypothetical protein